MARCVIEWAPGGEAEGARGRKEIDLLPQSELDIDPPETLCAREHGERITLTLDGLTLNQYLVLITSTARLAEVFVNESYVKTLVGSPAAVVAGETDVFYTLEVRTTTEAAAAPVVLRLAGIKGKTYFRLRRIQLVDVDGCSAPAAASAAAAPMQTQQQSMATLVALAASGQSERRDDDQHVPEGLRELYSKLATAPDSAHGEAVKQMAAALARGVMLKSGAGESQGPAGATGAVSEAAVAAAAASAAATSSGKKEARREAEPPPSADLERVLLRAIAESEARVLAAVDALSRRVRALEARLGAAAAAARDE